MKRVFKITIIVAVLFAGSFLLGQASRTAEIQFKTAQNKELVEGDLKGAIEQYKQLAEGSDRTIAAKALVRMGESYEKLGQPGALAVFNRVLRDYADQAAPASDARRRLNALGGAPPARPGNGAYTDAPELVDRRIWQDDKIGTLGRVSFDGRYFSFVDRSAGEDLAIRDLIKGVNRRLLSAGAGKVGASVPSRDGKRVAYSWRTNPESKGELRVIGVDDLQDRLVFSNTAVADVQPMDWTLDGRKILVFLTTQNGASRIAMVDLNGGPILNLTAFVGAKTPENISLSSDGLFIAYDVPQDNDAGNRDIFVLSTDGGFLEYPVIRDKANDTVLGWTPDSKRLLFASNRGGTAGIWAVDTRDGKASGSPPLRVWEYAGEVHALGITLGGTLLYSPGAREVRALEHVLPELARLQLAVSQQSQPSLVREMASIEGIVVRLGSRDPITDVDVELTRVEGTSSAPLAPGAAAAYAQARDTGGATGATPPAALAPEVQYAKTAADGRFVFRNLKPGKYRLVAARVGGAYNPAEYGQRDPAGRGLAFPIAQDQAMKDARLEMAPTGIITGRVLGESGEPLGKVRVLALRPLYKEGRRTLTIVGAVHSNERGEYRLFWLPPGRYYVAAAMDAPWLRQTVISIPPPGRAGPTEEATQPPLVPRILSTGEVVEEAYGLVYYGAVVDQAAAKPIDLNPGATFAAADIPMGVGKARAFHIRGVVLNGVTGKPAAGATVRYVQNQQSPHGLILQQRAADANGGFDLRGAVPGTYALFATLGDSAAGPGGATYLPVEVGNADVEDLKLTIEPAPVVSGRVVIQGRPPSENDPDRARIRVALVRDPDIVGMTVALGPVPLGSPANGVVAANGAFTLRISGGKNGARFRMSVSGIPAGTYVKAIRMGSMDILADGLQMSSQPENPLEITIGTDSGVILGVAMDDRQKALPNTVVALVPDSPGLRRRFDLYRNTTTDAYGRFQIQAVPPGDYKLFAWEYTDTDIWQDAQFLQDYEVFGKSIRIAGGSREEGIQLTAVPATRQGSFQ